MSSSATNRTLAVLLTLLALLSGGTSADEKRVSIYSPVATYTLPVLDRSGHEYVGLFETLEPLGRVNARVEGRHWKLRYNSLDADFVAGKTRAKVRGHDFDLAAPFLIENSRGLVPLSSLGTLLPRFLGSAVDFHEAARRLFIGGVATQVSAQMDVSNPPRLTLNFSAPVNPTISTEPGKLQMEFTRDPLVPPGNQPLTFANKNIAQLSYAESNGAAELTVLGTVSLMASFANNGRTIIVTATQSTAVGAGMPSQPVVSNPAPGVPQISGMPSPAPPAPGQRFFAVVDPAHGGDERGAALTATLAEKDVTLGFGRLLRHELEVRGIPILLLREGDSSLTLDQRAGAANAAKAAIYISLHAASQGNGARVYTALLPVEGPGKGTFHAWNAVQAPLLSVSQSMAAAVVSEMQKQQLPARGSSASLRPLNNLQMAAVAVELAPGPNGVAELSSANYQQKAAAAIADAVASRRASLEARP